MGRTWRLRLVPVALFISSGGSLLCACSDATNARAVETGNDPESSAASPEASSVAATSSTVPTQGDLGVGGTASAAPSRDPGAGGMAEPDTAASIDAGVVPAPSRPSLPSPEDVLSDELDAGGCDRELEFPTVLLDAPLPFDVVIVADHSGSIAWSRDELASGLSSLLERVHGRDVRFFVLTPTQYGADSAAFEQTVGYSPVDYADSVTGEPYAPAMTSYSQSCTDLDGAPIACPFLGEPPDSFELSGRFDFKMPEPAAQITREMSEAEVLAEQTKLADAVLELGTIGSPNEQPLCTLGRYVSQPVDALPEHVVIVVISDEDDSSDPNDCLTGIDLEKKPINQGDTCDGCELTRYTSRALGKTDYITYTCVPNDDMGQSIPGGAHDEAVYRGTYAECSTTDGPCNAADEQFALDRCDPGDSLDACEFTCKEQNYACQLDLLPSDVDACLSPFELDGVSYENFLDYCKQKHSWGDWQECSSSAVMPGDVPSAVPHLFPHPRTLLTDTSVQTLPTQALADYFVQTRDRVFGSDRAFVETIVFDPGFECVPESGQSYAQLLRSVATSDADVFPICESYAPALARIDDFAGSLLRTQYPLTLGPLEHIAAVVVTDLDGTRRTLGENDYTWDPDAGLLTLNEGVLSSSDRDLEIQLELDCGVAR